MATIAAGWPAEPVHGVREDPVDPEALYVHTRRDVHVPRDRGASGSALRAGPPQTPVPDLVVHPREHEWAVGIPGRSVRIVDGQPVFAKRQPCGAPMARIRDQPGFERS